MLLPGNTRVVRGSTQLSDTEQGVHVKGLVSQRCILFHTCLGLTHHTVLSWGNASSNLQITVTEDGRSCSPREKQRCLSWSPLCWLQLILLRLESAAHSALPSVGLERAGQAVLALAFALRHRSRV